MHQKIIDPLLFSKPADYHLWNYSVMAGGSHAFWNWSNVRNTKQDIMQDSLFCFPMTARPFSAFENPLGIANLTYELNLALHFSLVPFDEKFYRYSHVVLNKRTSYEPTSLACSVAKVYISFKTERLRRCLTRV